MDSGDLRIIGLTCSTELFGGPEHYLGSLVDWSGTGNLLIRDPESELRLPRSAGASKRPLIHPGVGWCPSRWESGVGSLVLVAAFFWLASLM